MKSILNLAVLWLLTASLSWAAEISQDSKPLDNLVIYTAKKIITMEPALPEATAVAVADGRIVAVGSLDSLGSWREQKNSRIDRRFEGKIIMPGFIEPHVHPSLPAVLTQFPFIAPDDWSLPTGKFPGAKTPKAYIARLKELVAQHNNPNIPFITWGYHPLWHGTLFRQQLSELFPDQAVMLWHRSFHELIGNDAAMDLLGVTEAQLADNPLTSWSVATSLKMACMC